MLDWRYTLIGPKLPHLLLKIYQQESWCEDLWKWHIIHYQPFKFFLNISLLLLWIIDEKKPRKTRAKHVCSMAIIYPWNNSVFLLFAFLSQSFQKWNAMLRYLTTKEHIHEMIARSLWFSRSLTNSNYTLSSYITF